MSEYIERAAAKRHLIQDYAYAAAELLDEIEAADVAPVVHGRWIYGEDIDIQCSVCGADALTEGDYRQVKSRYCPNCGAKMDLED